MQGNIDAIKQIEDIIFPLYAIKCSIYVILK